MKFENIVVLLSVFFIIGVLYIRTNMVLTNPMLLLFGFRIFEITYVELHHQEYNKTTLLLTKRAPWNGNEAKIEEISTGIHMELN
jgi:putative effector of murein hydrolase